jgi:nitrile hydratase accessory protein
MCDAHDVALQNVRRSIPGLDENGPLFLAPWQTRIFALVVAMVQQGHFPWTTFQSRLAALITEMERRNSAGTARAVETAYFDCWLRAVEDTLTSEGSLNAPELENKILDIQQTVAKIRAAQSA